MGKTILVADDSRTARMFIKQCLEISGLREATFLEANHGDEALTLLKSNKVDLVVTDVNMPVKDGVGLVKDMKASPAMKSIPIIVITSAQNPALDKQLTDLGVLAVVSKPVSPPKISPLLARIS